jgi:hypothetical protein
MQSTFSDSTYDEYKIIQKDAAMVYWKVYLRIYLDGLRKTTNS